MTIMLTKGAMVRIGGPLSRCNCESHKAARHLRGLVGRVDEVGQFAHHEEVLVEIQPQWFTWLPASSLTRMEPVEPGR